MRRITILLLMTMVAVLGLTSPAQAASAGALDTSFDGDGRVVYDVFGGVSDKAQAVAIQPDGKIVLAGSWCGFGDQCRTGTFAIARFNPDGSLDRAFGNSGRTLVAFPNGKAEATGVAIHTDGKIVAEGWRNDDDGVNDADFALVRLEPDGDLDPSFDGDGKVMTSFGGHDTGHGVAIQTDGKIVAAGISYDRVPCGVFDACDRDIALARYNPNGTLDPSFDGDGKVITALTGEEYVRAATIQSNGKVIVAGQTDGDFLLARYRTDGSEDSTFEGGAVGTDFGSCCDIANGVAIQPDGRIVAAGYTNVSGNFALARYHAITDGS